MSRRLKATILVTRTAVTPHRETHRWALVSTDSQSAALADLLAVELSRWPDVELVERAQIQRVLDELQLQAGGLVDAAGVQRFGTLTRADSTIREPPADDPLPPER